MILLNELEAGDSLSREDFRMFMKIIHPFVPHLAQELWLRAGSESYLDFESWPKYDPALIIEEQIKLVVQVNGKMRDVLTVDALSLTEAAAKKFAMKSEKVQAALGGKAPQKVIYVDKKLLNIVI